MWRTWPLLLVQTFDLVEPGSGSSLKTRLLLEQLSHPVAYVPVDISREHLLDAADRLNRLYPDLEVLPVCADFNQSLRGPRAARNARAHRSVFPRFHPRQLRAAKAVISCSNLRRLAGPDGAPAHRRGSAQGQGRAAARLR